MKAHRKIAIAGASLALGAAPALALAAGPPGHPGGHPASPGAGHTPSTPGPGAGLPAKAKAYGKYCQGESKQHVAGEKGTPFSKCVTDMAKVASGVVKNPRVACHDESKQHVAGQKGTPFSLCVSAAAKLLKDQPTGGTGTTTTTTTATTTSTEGTQTTETTSTTSSSTTS